MLKRKIAYNLYVSHGVYYVYILRSQKDKSLYIGYTDNLKTRIEQHNQGLSAYTKSKRPWRLVFYEAFTSRLDAKAREEYLKSGWGFRSIKKILEHTL